jgi:ABC-type antimicrobial peptide transport system permease subunit
MRLSRLVKRSLSYYWRTNLVVVLGVAVAVAVLAGALLVGDSVRASLRDLVIQRLGQTSFVVTSNSFVRDQLAADIQNDPEFASAGFLTACPLISLQGAITHEASKRVASTVKVYGVDDRFWKFNGQERTAPQNRGVFVSRSLATELATNPGDAMLLQIEKPSDIPLESLHSNKENLGKTVRLTVAEVLNAEALGDFTIQSQQTGVRAVFISLKFIQRELEEPEKVNLILISQSRNRTDSISTDALTKIVRQRHTIEDLGIKVRTITRDDSTALSLEHDSRMLNASLASATQQTANSLSLRFTGVFSYLANSISSNGKSIPYSLITAVDEHAFQDLLGNDSETFPSGNGLPPIILNEWAATDLGAKKGNRISLDYYFWQEGGRLETRTENFTLAAVVPITGLAADRDLVPEYPGITGSENLSDWDPPFPIDLKRVRPKDEDYWHQYRTTPKAFIPLKVGQGLWQSRFGTMTSVRLSSTSAPATNLANRVEEQLKSVVDPATMGVAVLPVRQQSLEASRGATDFGEYFLYFSFFLVASALLLTSLFFKLGVEQRVREIGTLRAMGFGPPVIRRLFLIEGLFLTLIGSVIGLLLAIAYAQLMMVGLGTWWVGAVGTTSLRLHISPASIAIGAVGGIIAALVCVAISLRGLRKYSTRGLLTGSIAASEKLERTSRRLISSLRLAVIFTLFGLSLVLAAAVHLVGQAAGFFAGGTLLLAALLCYQLAWLRQRRLASLASRGWWPIGRLGFRNTTYRPSRSILCIALIASAVFIIVAVDSFRHHSGTATLERHSGTGGFPLLAESVVPLVHDPNSREGQQALNLTSEAGDTSLAGLSLTRFRVQPGDDASCLNLFQPRNPKIIAPTDDFIKANRFAFQNTLASTSDEAANPWLLLNRDLPDGAVPVIADANSLTYVLHLKLGDDFILQRADHPIRLRVVAALSDSLFQSELLMSEKNFTRLFPDQQGYRFFLIDSTTKPDQAVAAALEQRLADYGFDVQSTSERLENFHRVENTYLSTFQMLGGLGLILGTFGLAAVLLRNVLERRRELALMRAVGYNSGHFTVMIIAENALLLFAGVVTGALCALLAIVPVLLTRQGQFSNISLGLLLLAVLISGLIASIVATWAAVRTPLLPALRAE